MTVRALLDWATRALEEDGLDTPRLDAEVILAAVLEESRTWLFTWADRKVDDGAVQAFHAAIGRRRRKEPVSYIVGAREFYNLRLRVTPAVLIPRADTETLVAHAIERLADRPSARVLDLCTGSGAVALALAANLPKAKIVATDISQEALEVARENASLNGLQDRVQWRRGDLWEAVRPGERFHAIVANPPYVSEEEFELLQPNVRDYEPRLALVAPENGLAIVRRIAEGATLHAEPGSLVAMEIGAGQGEEARALLRRLGYQAVGTRRDLAGHERVVWGETPSSEAMERMVYGS